MHRSLLTRSMATDLLAKTRQEKEYLQQVQPLVMLLTTSGQLVVHSLAKLPLDAFARLDHFRGIGKAFPDAVEAVIICEAWVAPASTTVAPSKHPGRQEAITISGRNRDNTKGILAQQLFTRQGTRIIWQAPEISNKSSSAKGLVDLIFDP